MKENPFYCDERDGKPKRSTKVGREEKDKFTKSLKSVAKEWT